MKLNAFLYWIAWPIGFAAIAIWSLKSGATVTTWQDVWQSLGSDPAGQAEIIATYRLPRIALGAVVGLNFALAGLVMQIVLRNPLADPTIFGISGGAALSVVAAMSIALTLDPLRESIGVSSSYLPLAWVPPIALVGGLVATAAVLWLSWEKGFSVARMTLNGVILGAILNALVMALVLSLSESRTELAILWLAGSLYARSLESLWPALPWTAIGLVAVLMQMRNLSCLRFDRISALSLGTPVSKVQPILVLVAAALASSAVSVAGPVGFVGLIVPHFARLIGAQSIFHQIWISVFAGALLVVFADTLGRVIIPPRELPVGIVTSLIGAPVFGYLLHRRLRTR